MKASIYPTRRHFQQLARHFLALGPVDRFLRFGWVMSDVEVVAYLECLFVSTDSVCAVVEPNRNISGVLHLESMGCGVNLGLSVSASARSVGIGTQLLQRAHLLAGARGLKTLFVRNLNVNLALQRLALRLGMNVACAPNARTASLEVPGTRDRDTRHDQLAGKITLADDSLRAQWSETPGDGSLLDLSGPFLRNKEVHRC
jgi:GNAT superfamily N-acetyltransferase